VKITKPVVTLSTNGKLLSQSNSENKTITIEPLNVSQIDTIELVIGWTTIGTFVTGILKKIPQLIAAFKPGSTNDIGQILGIPVEMTFSTYANGIFYQSTPQKVL
jgi:hypothetical protein